ncbi:MAG: glycosyltransferase 87 family protein [Promethearchaeia archaeon]
MSSFLFKKINPYETNTEFYYKYPPLFHYFINFFGLITNFTYIGPKLMVFCFDILNIIIIYKIGISLKNKTYGINASFYYAFNPIILLQFYNDVNEFVSLFFSLLAIYFILKNKLILSSISLTAGIAFKLYPIFFLIPISIFIYRNYKRGFFKVISYFFTIIIVFTLISLPFLIINSEIFFSRLLIHTNRMNKGDSITEQIPELSNLFKIAFKIDGIEISYQFIIQVIVLSVIFFAFLIQKDQFTIKNLFIGIILISFILPLINYQIQLKYTNLISFPFLVFLIYENRKSLKEIELYLLFFINLVLIIIFYILILIILSSFEKIISYEYLIQKGTYYGIFWMISFIIFIINEYQYKNSGDYKILVLIVLPFIIYNIFNNFIGVIMTIILMILTILYLIYKYC